MKGSENHKSDFVKTFKTSDGCVYTNYVHSFHGSSQLPGIVSLEMARIKMQQHRLQLARDLKRLDNMK